MRIVEHGTWRGYQQAKCRCDLCVAWNRKRVTKPGIDDVENQRPMSVKERIIEIEWIGNTDSVENIAERLNWPNVTAMLDAIRKAKRQDLVDKLMARREREWNRFDEKPSDS